MSTWKIKSSLEEWDAISRLIDTELHNFMFSEQFINSFMLALDEAFANISAYAYESTPGDVIIKSEYMTSSTDRTAKITFVDTGKKFNPLNSEVLPDLQETSSIKRTLGGLGIFLIKQQTDELNYSYTNSSNNLTLIKKENI